MNLQTRMDDWHDVVGLDACEGMLAIAERHAQAARAEGQPAPTFVVGDAVAPDVPDESLDAVTSRYLAWTWTLRDPMAAMTHCAPRAARRRTWSPTAAAVPGHGAAVGAAQREAAANPRAAR